MYVNLIRCPVWQCGRSRCNLALLVHWAGKLTRLVWGAVVQQSTVYVGSYKHHLLHNAHVSQTLIMELATCRSNGAEVQGKEARPTVMYYS